MFGWLRKSMPRGIYARAALIVALPFFALQIVVSIVFIQRHFEDVTRQMVDTQAIPLRYVLTRIEADGFEAARVTTAEPLDFDLRVASFVPSENPRLWYDFSGFTIIARLGELFDLRAIDLSNIRRVRVWIAEGDTIYDLEFERRRVSARNPHQLLVLMLVAGVFMIGISFIFLRNQLRPIRRLARAAEAFGRGEVEEYHASGASEVRAAGSAFMHMRARIERQIEQRTLLLSGVSHDLRTPLTRMRLSLSMMDESDEVKELRHDVDDMGQMIDAFLDFARVGAGEEAVETDLKSLLTECIEDARRSGLPVEVDGELPDLHIPLRAMGLRRSIANLVSNAARYGSRVRLGCALFERSLRIRVEDDGPGIPAEEREAATRPFTRLDAARNQNKGGSVGLGLAIAADTARRHGGTLRLGTSDALGGLCADLILAR
ncbi:MAG: ATP-binding protein [Pseudomonadota bacterium]